MTRNSTEDLVRALGILSIVLSMVCLCQNGVSVFSAASMMSLGPAMEQVQREIRVEQEAHCVELERQLEQTDDLAEQERIQREIEQAKRVPDMSQAMNQFMSPAMMTFSMIGAASGLVTNLILLIGGAGLLLLTPWGRKISLLAAILKIVNIIVFSLIQAFVIMPKMSEAMGEMMKTMPTGTGGPMPGFFPKMMEMMGVAQAVITILFVSIYPVVLLVLLNLKDVRLLLSGNWPQPRESGMEDGDGRDDLAPRNIRDY